MAEIQSERPLPAGWVWTTIGEVVAKISNGITRRQSKEKIGLPVTRIETISDGTINLERVRYLDGLSEKTIAKYRLLPGDILFSHINSDAHLGKTALLQQNDIVLLHGMNLLLLRTDQNLLLPRALHYLCNFYRFSGKFVSIAQHAVNQSSINQTKLKAVAIPLPPLPEQRRIVAEIETQFTRLDAGVAALERARANLRRYKASVLKAACEGRLVPTEADLARAENRAYEPAGQLLTRILAEHRVRWEAEHPSKKYKEPSPPDTKNLPELPEGWEWVTLGVACKVILGQSPPSSTYNTDRVGLPFYQGKAEFGTTYPTPVKWCSKPKKIAKADDILISVRAPVGPTNLCHEKSCIGRGLSAIRPRARMSNLYFFYFLRSIEQDWQSKATGTTFSAINGKVLREQEVPLPPLAEQHRIVAEVERRLSVVAALEASVEAGLARARRLRQSILKRAFEGRLVPQNPDDEPAPVLLEKIRGKIL